MFQQFVILIILLPVKLHISEIHYDLLKSLLKLRKVVLSNDIRCEITLPVVKVFDEKLGDVILNLSENKIESIPLLACML